jgi:peptidoglycan/LPS O-acetylase OafA/YrhL
VHYPILNLAEKWSDNRLVVGISALVISVVIAFVMHLLVERPMANLRRRFGSRTTEVIDSPRSTAVVGGGSVEGIAARPLDNRGEAKTMAGYSEWKPQLGSERGS